MKYFILMIFMCFVIEGCYSIFNKEKKLSNKKDFLIGYSPDILLIVIFIVGLILSYLFINNINSFYNNKILASTHFLLLFFALIFRIVYVVSNFSKL